MNVISSSLQVIFYVIRKYAVSVLKQERSVQEFDSIK